tara:strand:- start:2064 stop:2813 length:750 start_codon:yes stop_codon:yes gene_type:complete
MTKGVLLFCFDTEHTKYHKILERSVGLIKKNLKLPITVVTNFSTFKQTAPLGMVNYKFIEPETGNTKLGKSWNNADRHMAYELSPYDHTLVLDIDYFCFSDNLLQLLDTNYDFLVPNMAYDLTNRNSFDHRKFSVIPMVWATVLVFKKSKKAKRIFDMVKYVKNWYAYFVDLYRLRTNNLRNDYVFAIALQQLNGFVGYDTFPFALSTLPPDCKIVQFDNNGLKWQCKDNIDFIAGQDVHVLNKEIADV